MKIRVLGAHNLETADARHTCFLVNDVLAIDAGSLMTALTPGQRDGLEAVLLTHRHFDHMRDLPSLALATMDNGATVSLYGLPDTLDALSSRLLDGLLYPNFTQRPTAERPKYRLHPIAPGQTFMATGAAGLEARAAAMPHGAPAVGYVLRSSGGAAAFSGDTGGGLHALLSDPFRPSLLFVEVTFSNAAAARARGAGHLAPSLLEAELASALARGLPVPKIVAVHMDQRHEEAIRRELAAVSSSLGVDIVPGAEAAEFLI